MITLFLTEANIINVDEIVISLMFTIPIKQDFMSYRPLKALDDQHLKHSAWAPDV